MTGSFHTPDDVKWSRALEACTHDMYHLPGFALMEGEWEGARPEAFVYRTEVGTMVLPLLLRRTPALGLLDAVTPYGYSGPAFSKESTTGFRGHALAAYDAAARDRGILTTFMRLHPLLASSLAPAVKKAGLGWEEVARGETVTMPLGASSDEWLLQIRKSLRYDIRVLLRLGYAFEFDPEQGWAVFPSIYQETMARIGATDRYRYSPDYIRRFRENLNGAVRCAIVRTPEGEIACAGLFSQVGGIVQYHLSGTRSSSQKRSPTKLLLAGMREESRASGADAFHLGGGVNGARDSLFRFKAGFGGRALPFRTVHAIHDPTEFQAECEAWAERTGNDAHGEVSFFPPYRVEAPA